MRRLEKSCVENELERGARPGGRDYGPYPHDTMKDKHSHIIANTNAVYLSSTTATEAYLDLTSHFSQCQPEQMEIVNA